MRRRDFITLLGGAAAWPIPAHAQPTRDVRRIAVLMGTTTNDLGRSYLATFTQRLEQLGWSDGRNARIEIRWWSGTLEQMRPVAAELVALSPDVIMAFSNMSATATLVQAVDRAFDVTEHANGSGSTTWRGSQEPNKDIDLFGFGFLSRLAGEKAKAACRRDVSFSGPGGCGSELCGGITTGCADRNLLADDLNPRKACHFGKFRSGWGVGP